MLTGPEWNFCNGKIRYQIFSNFFYNGKIRYLSKIRNRKIRTVRHPWATKWQYSVKGIWPKKHFCVLLNKWTTKNQSPKLTWIFESSRHVHIKTELSRFLALPKISMNHIIYWTELIRCTLLVLWLFCVI